MSDETVPDWARTAPRIDRPEITTWYKPENGPLDGVLIWRGQMEHPQPSTCTTRTRFGRRGARWSSGCPSARGSETSGPSG